MDIDTCKMVQGYERILYISCNPETLQENLQVLGETHQVVRFALFDQFPYTHHMEAGVMLERKSNRIKTSQMARFCLAWLTDVTELTPNPKDQEQYYDDGEKVRPFLRVLCFDKSRVTKSPDEETGETD